LPAGALIILGLVLVGGAYIGWYRLSGEGRLPAETVAPLPARLANLADQAIPGLDGRIPLPEQPAPAPPRASDDDQFEPREAATENPLLMPDPPPPPPPPPIEEMRSASMSGGTATTAIAMPVMPQMPRPEPPLPAVTTPTPVDLPPTDASRVVLRATGDSWVQVKERGGQQLIGKVMKAGETFPVPDRANLLLTTGNAGRVEVVVDGAVMPSLGAVGTARKDVPLDPDQLKAGTPAVPPAKR
jgi:cytoskeleton protein RodZ